MAERLPADRKRSRRALDIQLFVKRYARKAHTGQDPNDRRHDRRVEDAASRMRPEEFDALLRDGEDGPT